MITYVYETIPTDAQDEIERFEWRQRISEAPLKHHPETGKPVHRVISGGLGFASSSRGIVSSGCCQGSCGSC